MYAIVEIAGKQFRVAKEQNIKVPRLEADSGSKIKFDKVLFYSDDSGKTQVGKPDIGNMAVSATIVEHGRDKKIVVFKKKRRKGYQVKNGHRQGFSVIKIDDIGVVKKTAKPAQKEEAKAKPAPKTKSEEKSKPKAAPKKAVETKAEPVKKSTTAKKSSPAKKSTAKKTTAKKTTSSAKKETTKKTTAKPKAKKVEAKNKKQETKEDKEA
jgi:large subunit ribosomal protein L21